MAAQGLEVEDRGGTRVLTLANPPSNAVGLGVRKALLRAIRDIGPGCSRIVLAAKGPTFSSALPLDPDLQAPTLAEVCHAVEHSGVPVVAALQGLVMGAGAELALAAAARIAVPNTRIAFPEVALGLCPEGGATRRLPGLVGAEAALQLLISGRAARAEEAKALGLIDALSPDPLALALTFAVPGARRDMSNARATAVAVAAARRQHSQPLPAVARIIGCVEAATLLPPEAHAAFEAVAREDLEVTPEAAALRAAVRAERRAAVLPASLVRVTIEMPDRIALHGLGPPLLGLAEAALGRGIGVDWIHATESGRAQARLALKARLSDAQMALLQDDGSTSDAPCRVIAAQGGARQAGQAILLFGPAETALGITLAGKSRTAELAVPAGTPSEAIARGLAVLRHIGIAPVLVGFRPVLGSGVHAAGVAALAHLAQSGVPHRALGAALTGFGATLPAGLPPPEAAPRDMAAPDILNRWLGAQANEGLRLLDLGIARRPSDIDLLLMQGYGFPRWRCGPMHQAAERGLLVLRHDLRIWAADDPIWSPAPLLDRLIQDGQRLVDLDQAELV